MNIHLEQYRVFAAVAEQQSFSRAAETLFMSQSAVSQAVKNLEMELGLNLFQRHSRGVRLSEEGRLLYEYVANALSLLETAEEQLAQIKQMDRGELRIGVSDTVSRYFLLPYLERFHERYPKIQLRIANRVSQDAVTMLKAGKLDLAFVNLPLEDEKVDIRPAMAVEDIFVAGPRFAHLRGRSLSLADIASLPLILLEEKSNSRNCLDAFFLSQGIRLQPEIELGAHDLLLDFAKGNLGISCVIREFSQGPLVAGEVFALELQTPLPKRHIGICTLKGVTLPIAAETFCQFLGQ